MKKKTFKSSLTLAIDEEHHLSKKQGGGILRLQAWTDNQQHIQRYSLAYINPLIFSGDNGRVLGYDDAHNYHHKHYFGEVLEVEFISFQDTLEKFEQEWRAIAHEYCH
jgi:hypothetical protein